MSMFDKTPKDPFTGPRRGQPSRNPFEDPFKGQRDEDPKETDSIEHEKQQEEEKKNG